MRGVPYDVDECPEYGRAPFATKVLYAELRGRAFDWCPGETAADAVHRAAMRRRVRRTAGEVAGDLRAAVELGLARVVEADGGAGTVEFVALPPSVQARRSAGAARRSAARERVAVRREGAGREPKGDPDRNYASALANHIRRLAVDGDPRAVFYKDRSHDREARRAVHRELEAEYLQRRAVNGERTGSSTLAVAPATGPAVGTIAPPVAGPVGVVVSAASPVPESGSGSEDWNSSKELQTPTHSGNPNDPTSPVVNAREAAGPPVNGAPVNTAAVNSAPLTAPAALPRGRPARPPLASFRDTPGDLERLAAAAMETLAEAAGDRFVGGCSAPVRRQGFARLLLSGGWTFEQLEACGAHWREADLAEVFPNDVGIARRGPVTVGLLLGSRLGESGYEGARLDAARAAMEEWRRKRRLVEARTAPAASLTPAPNIPGPVKTSPLPLPHAVAAAQVGSFAESLRRKGTAPTGERHLTVAGEPEPPAE